MGVGELLVHGNEAVSQSIPALFGAVSPIPLVRNFLFGSICPGIGRLCPIALGLNRLFCSISPRFGPICPIFCSISPFLGRLCSLGQR
jgi:hypothetical protein